MKRLTMVMPGVVLSAWLAMAGGVQAAGEAGKTNATMDNLQAAYNGEVNAKVRYEAFAAKADEEGYKAVAALFRAASNAEMIHARNFGKQLRRLSLRATAVMEKPVVKSTRENLESALQGETHEETSMYPGFLKQAETDNRIDVASGFKTAMAAEAEHARLFTTALAALDEWKAPGREFAVCQSCGFTVMGATPEACPVCESPREKFKPIP